MTNITISSDKSISTEVVSDKQLNLQVINNSSIDLTVGNSPIFTLGITQPAENIIDVSNISLELTLDNKDPISLNIDSKESTYEFTQNLIAGPKGDKGDRGEQGFSGNTQSSLASTDILAFKLIRYDLNGKVKYCSSNNINDINTLIGMSINSGLQDSEINYQLFGSIQNDSWNYIPNTLLYLGINGEIATTQTGVFSQSIGYVETPTRIFLKIGRSIIRG